MPVKKKQCIATIDGKRCQNQVYRGLFCKEHSPALTNVFELGVKYMSDTDLYNLSMEIGAITAMQQSVMENTELSEEKKREEYLKLAHAKALLIKADMDIKARRHYFVSMSQVIAMLSQIAHIIRTEVKDEELVSKIAERLRTELQIPLSTSLQPAGLPQGSYQYQ